jgi:hypothetical protein
MLAVTSRQVSGQMRLVLEIPQPHKLIPVLSADGPTDLMPIQNAIPVEPVSYYPCMHHP